MPTARENLLTRRNTICAELAAITTSKTTTSADGQSEAHDQHRETLLRELKEIEALLALPSFSDAGEGQPWIHQSRGTV